MAYLRTVVIGLLLIASALLYVAGRAGAEYHPCADRADTVQDFRPFSAKVWAPERWRRGAPPRKTSRAAYLRRRCAASGEHRRAMKRVWRTDRRKYGRYRLYRQVARHSADGYGVCDAEHPSPSDKCWWAIPAYIVCGESGFRFHLWENADGAYQIIPGTWASAGGGRFAPYAGYATPLEQHLIAHRLWGTTAWYGAC